MGEKGKNPGFSSVAATFEKANTYVFAGCLIRNSLVGAIVVRLLARAIPALTE